MAYFCQVCLFRTFSALTVQVFFALYENWTWIMVVDWSVHLWRSPADKAVWSPDVRLLANDRLRITHDLYSHAKSDQSASVLSRLMLGLWSLVSFVWTLFFSAIINAANCYVVYMTLYVCWCIPMLILSYSQIGALNSAIWHFGFLVCEVTKYIIMILWETSPLECKICWLELQYDVSYVVINC
jgi:hypothetical protein